MIISAMKRYIVSHKSLADFAIKVRDFLFECREKDKSFGSLHPQKKFYVIRGNTRNVGLLAIYFTVLTKIHRAISDGWIPIVDFQNYKTAYSSDSPVNGTRNMWEYYFDQPSSYTLDEVYHSRNVRLSSGIHSGLRGGCITLRERIALAPVKKEIRDFADEKVRQDGIADMIGVLARGTDYSAMKPVHHDVPATAEQTAEVLDDFLQRHGERRILLATEDGRIYDYFVRKYGNLIYTTDGGIHLIRNYSGKDFIAAQISPSNKYQLGLDYLIRMLCLSQCKCLIASTTHGTAFARALNNGRYAEEYIFKLGRY